AGGCRGAGGGGVKLKYGGQRRAGLVLALGLMLRSVAAWTSRAHFHNSGHAACVSKHEAGQSFGAALILRDARAYSAYPRFLMRAPQDEGGGTFGWQELAALDRRNRRV